MIWSFLDLINHPEEYALTWNGREFRAERLDVLQARGARIRALPLDGTRGSAARSDSSTTIHDPIREGSDSKGTACA